jgi:hypothetical protein
MNDQAALELVPPGVLTWLLLSLILMLAPIIIGLLALFQPEMREQAFVLVLVGGLTTVIGFALLLAATRRSVHCDGKVLDIRATLYRRRIALDQIDLAQARVLDLREHSEFRPWLKTNGFAVPGLAAGHFRDRRKNRLFCLVTDPKVLMLPLADGRRLLISFRRPAAALDYLLGRRR